MSSPSQELAYIPDCAEPMQRLCAKGTCILCVKWSLAQESTQTHLIVLRVHVQLVHNGAMISGHTTSAHARPQGAHEDQREKCCDELTAGRLREAGRGAAGQGVEGGYMQSWKWWSS
eukprot:1141087-Pelagomonas_calceolata.AAC.10